MKKIFLLWLIGLVFTFSNFNCSSTDKKPLFYSTFLGGENEVEPYRGASIVIDKKGYIYMIAKTSSPDSPVTQGLYSDTLVGGSDILLAKFDPQLKTLVQSTIIGGMGDEGECKIAIGPENTIYIAGETTDKNFLNATNIWGQNDKAVSFTFVAEISANFKKILSSAVISCELSPRTGVSQVKYDKVNKRIIVAGTTASQNFPISTDAVQPNFAGGPSDKFVTMLNLELSEIKASTYFGGSGRDGGVAGLDIDWAGNVYIGGNTFSPDYPTSDNVYKKEIPGGRVFGAVTKFNKNLTKMLASTLVGEGGNDFVYGMCLDENENVVFSGHVWDEMKVTPGVYKTTNVGNPDVANVGILSNDLSKMIAHTYIVGGGQGSFYGGYSYCGDILTDDEGFIYVIGTSDVEYFPTTPGAFDETHNGERDIFICKLNSDLSGLVSSTLLGGVNRDVKGTFAFDPSGNIVLTGTTTSSDFPVSTQGFDTEFSNKQDFYVLKINKDLKNPETSPIHEAAKLTDCKKMKSYLKSSPEKIDDRDTYGRTPLHWAAKFNDFKILEYLLGEDAQVNSSDFKGYTPLHLAALFGQKKAAKILIANGANINQQDKNGDTPLHLAAFTGHAKIAEILCEHNAEFNNRNNIGNTPLHRAAYSRQLELAKLLLIFGADPNVKNKEGETPLHLACNVLKNEELIVLLLNNKAEINVKNNVNQTPMHYAAGYYWRGNTLEMLKAHPNVNNQDNEGNTPLHYAVSRRMTEAVTEMMKLKANKNIKNKEGESPLDFAVKFKNDEIIKILKSK